MTFTLSDGNEDTLQQTLTPSVTNKGTINSHDKNDTQTQLQVNQYLIKTALPHKPHDT